MRYLNVDFNNGESVPVVDIDNLVVDNDYIPNRKLKKAIMDLYSTNKVKDIVDDFYKTYREDNNIETPMEEYISKCRNKLECISVCLNINGGGLKVSYDIKMMPYNPNRHVNMPFMVNIILDEDTYEFIDYDHIPGPLVVHSVQDYDNIPGPVVVHGVH
jgi:hypothetical protein